MIFRRKRPDTPKAWLDTTPEQLQERAVPLLVLAAAAVAAAQRLVASPGSREGEAFLGKTHALQELLVHHVPAPQRLKGAAVEFSKAAEAYSDWQTETLDHLTKDIGRLSRQLAFSASSALSGQEEAIEDVQRLSRGLDQALESRDLQTTRKAISAQLQSANEVIRRQQALHEEMLREFREAMNELESKLRQSEIERNTDALTKIANRASLDLYLEAILRKSQMEDRAYSLAIADMNRFKEINDTMGHLAGDEALRTFAALFEAAAAPEGFVARYGGDEFVLVLPVGPAALERRMKRFLRALESRPVPLRVGQQSYLVELAASYGIATVEEGDTVTTLLKRADDALYANKRAARPARAAAA